jgi:Protein of unknown function (DUF2950)
MKTNKINKYRMMPLLAGSIALFFMVLSAIPALTEVSTEQKYFSSPQLTVEALVAAVRNNDDSELLAILGPGSGDLIFSGDKVADENGRARFLKAYEEKNRLERINEDQAILIMGSREYPLPLPIVHQEEGWRFDTRAGMEEILNRRIGRNELQTIEVMQAYTEAQREYACMNPNPEGSEFAQKLTSTEGKKDGLYWEVMEGEAESPFGPLVAQATEEGYDGDLDQEPPEPFHGYYFKILKKQGDHAEGGAFDYVADGKMILGFALVAYPAKYGASGIMTFIVNQEGVVYEKDLGEDTAKVAAAINTFDPDETWNRYDESTEQ